MRNSKARAWFLPVLLVLLVQCNNNPPMPGGDTFKMPMKKSVLLSNGETYAYLEQEPEQAQPEEEVFLLIHGNFSSSAHMAPLFRYLNHARLLAPDMRGFGDSSYNSGFSSLGELAEDIKLFTDALGISKVHVVGWSLGGGIALELAVLYPDLVSSLFIVQGMSHRGMPFFKIGPGGTFVPYSGKDDMATFSIYIQQEAALKAKDADFFERSWNNSIYTNKKPTSAENTIYLTETLKQRCLLDVYWSLAWFNLSGVSNGYTGGNATIGSLACPVTFTCALNDLVIVPAVIRDNAQAVPGSKLIEYKNCGHSPLVDNPQQLAEDIRAHVGN